MEREPTYRPPLPGAMMRLKGVTNLLYLFLLGRGLVCCILVDLDGGKVFRRQAVDGNINTSLMDGKVMVNDGHFILGELNIKLYIFGPQIGCLRRYEPGQSVSCRVRHEVTNSGGSLRSP